MTDQPANDSASDSAHDPARDPTSDFARLMAAVGNLIFHSCLLEDALTDEIRRLRSESESGVDARLIRVKGSFSERLAEWRALLSLKSRRNAPLAEAVVALGNEIEQLRRKRNLVAHDFAGATARPEDGEPHIWCAYRDKSAGNSEKMPITLAELTETIDAIDRCRGRLPRIELSRAA